MKTATRKPSQVAAHHAGREHCFRANARASFANHTIRMRLNSGLFRSWRCQNISGSWIYGFDITLTPGHLIVTGDIGDLIVSRCADMLPWARSAVDSTSYFAEKVPHSIVTKEYSAELARATINDDFRELSELCGVDGAKKERKRLREIGWDKAAILARCDEEHQFWQAIRESGFYDGGDYPRVSQWNANFLWCREAVRWFLEHELCDYAI